MKLFILRLILCLGFWIPTALWVVQDSREAFEGTRFEFLVLSNGRVSSIQRETLFSENRKIESGDRIIQISTLPFSKENAAQVLEGTFAGSDVPVLLSRKGSLRQATMHVRGYSDRDVLVLFILPMMLSIIFLAFAIFTPFQKFNFRKTQEAVEVFSFLCLGLSFYFLLFLPSVNFALPVSASIGLPILSALFLHLFLVYPKKKAPRYVRWSLLAALYAISLGLVIFRINFWSEELWWYPLLDSVFMGACVVLAMGSLGNTLFTSRDFWTRRRARLLSLVFLLSFTALIGVYISFIWHGPRISLERILAVSLLFPAAFAFIFSKENVFDLERIFRRGLHQFLFLGVAITFAVLIGLSWTQWRENATQDWILWAAIAMAVTLFARPVGNFFERHLHRMLRTRVRYPKVDEIFASSRSVEDFLTKLSKELEKNLSLKEISFRFLKDPSAPWGDENEQFWQSEAGHMVPRKFVVDTGHYRSFLRSSGFLLGEIRFSGGDGIAFDPANSSDWDRICHAVARCLELLILREFLVTQQSLLAVGRMQALLAHEMKNPLAVIKVCSGLLHDRIQGDDEAEEIVRTIQAEVTRVAQAVQKVFDHPSRHEKRSRAELCTMISEVRQVVLARFPDRSCELKLKSEPEGVWGDQKIWVWMEVEAFQQSLTNLFINAFEADSPSLELELDWEPGRRLRLRVADKGAGIARDVELFKPFVSTKAFGTGLGLSQVKAFVDRHFGKIQVHSKLNQGTTFYLDFPASIFVKEEEWRSAQLG